MTSRPPFVLGVTVAAAVVAVLVDVAVGAAVPGRIAALGFFGCAAIILGSKWVGKRLLSRPEAYYADPETEDLLNVEHLGTDDPVGTALTGDASRRGPVGGAAPGEEVDDGH